MLVYAKRGIAPALLGPLALVSAIETAGRRWQVAPLWMGPRQPGGLFGPARSWQAITPYVTPRHTRGRTRNERPRRNSTLEKQLADEISKRGLSAAAVARGAPTRSVGGRLVPALAFEMDRGISKPHADFDCSFPEVTFQQPEWGPLAFGFGCHFGLGLLAPVE